MPFFKDIHFRCGSCGGSLVVDRAAAGLQAPCPHCSASIRVPIRSEIPPVWRKALLLSVSHALLLGIAIAYMRAGRPPEDPLRAQAARVVSAAKPATPPDPPASPISQSLEARNSVEARAHQAEQDYRELNTRYEELGNWILENVKGRFPMPDRMMGYMRTPAVDDAYALHPDVVELLSVNPEEKVKVDDALGSTRGVIDGLVAAQMTVTQTAPDKATVYIPAFPEAGRAARDDLYAALSSTLGDARFRRLIEVGGEALEKRYDYFGEAQRTMVFEESRSADDPEDAFLVIKDGWIRPDGDHARRYEVKESSVRELPAEYAGLIGVLPAPLQRYAKP